MIELLRTNDPVLISWLTAVLGEIGVEIIVFDSHTSILGGSANAIRRRVMVIDDDFADHVVHNDVAMSVGRCATFIARPATFR